MKRLLILIAFIGCQSSSKPEEIIDLRCDAINRYVIDKDTASLNMSFVQLDKLVRLYPNAKNVEKGQALLNKRDSLIGVANR
jgi:outer membrane protein assembly factor BamD (BamD/ComL family)